MSAEEKDKGTRALIASVMGRAAADPQENQQDQAPRDAGGDSEEAQDAHASVPSTQNDGEQSAHSHPDHGAAVELIDVYFELEDPLERDAAFDELCVLEAPIVVEFLRSMLHGDDDDYVRAAAAGELARRGDAEGRGALLADIEDPDSLDHFTNAIEAFAEIDGEAFYPRLVELWQDPERDDDQRREAMAVMEWVAPERAVADFVGALGSLATPEALLDDQLEVMTLAFVRQDVREAIAPLDALARRVDEWNIDPSERRETVELIREAIALLNTAENS